MSDLAATFVDPSLVAVRPDQTNFALRAENLHDAPAAAGARYETPARSRGGGAEPGRETEAAAITLLASDGGWPYGRNDDEIDSDGMVRSGTSTPEWAIGVTLADPPSAALEGRDGG